MSILFKSINITKIIFLYINTEIDKTTIIVKKDFNIKNFNQK